MWNLIKKQLKESARVKIQTATLLSGKIAAVAECAIATYKNGNKLLLAGNGGNAADVRQHIATEPVGRFVWSGKIAKDCGKSLIRRLLFLRMIRRGFRKCTSPQGMPSVAYLIEKGTFNEK